MEKGDSERHRLTGNAESVKRCAGRREPEAED